jgi:hypothetical protein
MAANSLTYGRGARVLAGRLPVIEAGAASRLVIGAPVGHFPRKAYEGGGILAPIEREKFVAFLAATLSYYKENSREYRVTRLAIHQAARKFDWQHSIQGRIDLIEGGARGRKGVTLPHRRESNALRPKAEMSMCVQKTPSSRMASVLGKFRLRRRP